MTEIRICFVGDSLTAGTGDESFLGWPGRVCNREAAKDHDVTLYNLGIRANTSADIAARWRDECRVRMPEGTSCGLIFSFGVNDAAEEVGVGVRVPLEQSLANAGAILREAKSWLPTLWIGPPPVVEEMMPVLPGTGVAYNFNNARTKALSNAYRSLAAELDIPYLDVFDTLAADATWSEAQKDSDGIHAMGHGYERLADLIGAWTAWRKWFDG